VAEAKGWIGNSRTVLGVRTSSRDGGAADSNRQTARDWLSQKNKKQTKGSIHAKCNKIFNSAATFDHETRQSTEIIQWQRRYQRDTNIIRSSKYV
jgi:hypothetical protein